MTIKARDLSVGDVIKFGITMRLTVESIVEKHDTDGSPYYSVDLSNRNPERPFDVHWTMLPDMELDLVAKSPNPS